MNFLLRISMVVSSVFVLYGCVYVNEYPEETLDECTAFCEALPEKKQTRIDLFDSNYQPYTMVGNGYEEISPTTYSDPYWGLEAEGIYVPAGTEIGFEDVEASMEQLYISLTFIPIYREPIPTVEWSECGIETREVSWDNGNGTATMWSWGSCVYFYNDVIITSVEAELANWFQDLYVWGPIQFIGYPHEIRYWGLLFAALSYRVICFIKLSFISVTGK